MAGLKSLLKRGVAPSVRRLTAGLARILMYHRFGPPDTFRRLDPQVFEQHLIYLKKNYNVCRLSEVVGRLRDGVGFRPRSVVLTVDDGYADFGRFAYPLLEKYEVPATLYVVTEFVDGDIWLWFDAVMYLLESAASGTYSVPGRQNDRLDLRDSESRTRAWCSLTDEALVMSPEDRRAYIAQLEGVLGVVLPDRPTEEYAALTWDDLRGMRSDLVEVGAHTCTHHTLSRCSAADVADQVERSKSAIERRLNREVPAFCYPNGQPADVDEKTVLAVKRAGFTSAVMACGAFVRPGAEPLLLERVAAGSVSELSMQLAGFRHVRRVLRGSEQLVAVAGL